MTDPLDVVWIVRQTNRDEDLRYSLRSVAAHLPHRRVFIVGHKPRWVTNVEWLPTIQNRTKWENSTRNTAAACRHPALSDRFVYMNDDFFVMAPIDEVPPLHRGPLLAMLDDYGPHRRANPGGYLRRIIDGDRLLREWGYAEPLSYELHAPMVIDKASMLEVLDRYDTKLGLPYRSLYGNVAAVGGERIDDVKLHNNRQPVRWPDTAPFLSTNKATFHGPAGLAIRAAFPDRSPYEKADR